MFDLFADTYVKARKLSIVAEETSNVESADETVTKRKRKEPVMSDVEDGDGMLYNVIILLLYYRGTQLLYGNNYKAATHHIW